MAAEGDKTVVQPSSAGSGSSALPPDAPTLPTVPSGAHTLGTHAAPGATTRDVAPPAIPDVELQGQIGRGGMGVVWRGRQTYLDRAVAVKLLLIDEERGGAEYVRRFQREARILAGLSHPHIVACYQAGLTPQERLPYLVMEFIDGPNLRDHLRQHGPLPVPEALMLLRDLGRALGHAEQAGIIHRDIKPENVLLATRREATPAGETPWVAKLVDLGLARPASRAPGAAGSDMHLTQQGVVMGTPATMAPEQFGDPDHVDYRADIYGLGCVLFHALTGRPAFPQGSLGEILSAKVSGAVPNPSSLRQDLPAGVVELCQALLAREPAERPADYRAIIARCASLLAGEGRSAHATRWLVPVLVAAGAVVIGIVIAALTMRHPLPAGAAPATTAPAAHAALPAPVVVPPIAPLDQDAFAKLVAVGKPTPWLSRGENLKGWNVPKIGWGVAEDNDFELSGIHGWASHPLPSAAAGRVSATLRIGSAKAFAMGVIGADGYCCVTVVQNISGQLYVRLAHGHLDRDQDPQHWGLDVQKELDPKPSLDVSLTIRGRDVHAIVGGLIQLPVQTLTGDPATAVFYADGEDDAPVLIERPEFQHLR